MAELNQANARPNRRRLIIQVAGFVVAIGLLGGSIFYAVRDGNFQPLTQADPQWVIALLAVTLLSAVVINGFLFWLVHKPFADVDRPVRAHEMLLIISASALLNYTPVKAGLIGRAAYVKHRHGIGYAASVLIHLMIAGALFGSMLGMLGATVWRGRIDAWWWATVAVSVPTIAIIGAIAVQRMLPRRVANAEPDANPAALRHSFGWSVAHLSVWIVIGYALLLITAVRWWLVCKVMDQPVPVGDALLMAITHSASSILPANGLGMREWLIGVLFGGNAPADFVAISLIDRAAEAVVVIPAGLIGLWWLHRQLRKLPTTEPEA